MDARFLRNRVTHYPLVLGLLLTVAYFILIAFAFPIGNVWLFAFLIFGEVFHVFQVAMYIYTVWRTDIPFKPDDSFTPKVDIFVTVAGEPADIVRETIVAIQKIKYPSFKTYILNDGYVAKKENWEEMEQLAAERGIGCITRKTPGGAKAGNINNGLRETSGEYVVIFDADHVPHPNFLERTIPLMADQKVAFVQSPQYYKNHDLNYVTGSAWEQQELFFGPICKGKNRVNAATMCGTNMVIKREALLEVGGMSEESIAEDFLTGMLLHAKGYKSIYVPEVLAEGLAPEDFLSYYKQQFRWARGALDMIFGKQSLFGAKLTRAQKMQYFSSVSFYLSGLIVLIDALIPVVFFYTGAVPLTISTMTLALVFLPYLFVTLYILDRSSNSTFTFRSLTFSIACFNIHIQAIMGALMRKKATFVVTPKRQQAGNFINLVIPHLLYIVIVAGGMIVTIMREGFTASFITNSAWALLNIAVFIPFIHAAIFGSRNNQ
jgi:cellulose synthase (UDP-forming)